MDLPRSLCWDRTSPPPAHICYDIRWAYQTTWPASWETCMQVRKQQLGHGTTDCFQIGKGVRQGCILSPCLSNLYAEYIMRNIGLEEAQCGIKIARKIINNLRYADDTTLMAESEEELKSPWRRWKRRVKNWLKTQHSESKDHGIQSHHFTAKRWGNSGNSGRLLFFWTPKSLQMVMHSWN